MNLPRIFANAVARRVALVLVALAFGFIASCFQPVHAQASCASPESTCTRPQAYAACQAEISGWRDYAGTLDRRLTEEECLHAGTDSVGVYTAFANVRGASNQTIYDTWHGTAQRHVGCPSGVWNGSSCESCSSRPPLGSGAWGGVNSDMQMCYDGCTFEGGIGQGVGVCLPVTIDGNTYQQCTSWGPTGQACSAGVDNGSLAPPDSDGDGTSDGNDSSPNNPGSGGGGKGGKPGEDGSSSCGGPDQPACEADGSNSGSGKGNTSGGGGNCQTPPSSTGDAILAQIAYQAWATRCAVEGLGEGGTGTGPGAGDGDGAKEGTLKGIKDFLDGKGQELPEAEDPWMDGLPGEPSDWNLGLGGGSCPAPVSTSISFGGASAPIEFSFQPMCDLAGLLNTLFKALGALIAAYIIAGVRR